MLFISLFFLGPLYGSPNPPFSMIIYYVGQMILDPGISIKGITDHSDYIKFKGHSQNQLQAYLLAEKLLSSNMQKEFKFEDIVPFWNEKNKSFIFILKKSDGFQSKNSLTIESPLPRANVNGSLQFSGGCSSDSEDILISGDFSGKTKCKDHRWKIQFPKVTGNRLPLLGIKVMQKNNKQKYLKNFRSFKYL